MFRYMFCMFSSSWKEGNLCANLYDKAAHQLPTPTPTPTPTPRPSPFAVLGRVFTIWLFLSPIAGRGVWRGIQGSHSKGRAHHWKKSADFCVRLLCFYMSVVCPSDAYLIVATDKTCDRFHSVMTFLSLLPTKGEKPSVLYKSSTQIQSIFVLQLRLIAFNKAHFQSHPKPIDGEGEGKQSLFLLGG